MPVSTSSPIEFVRCCKVGGEYFATKEDAENHIREQTFKRELKDLFSSQFHDAQVQFIIAKLQSEAFFPALSSWVKLQEKKRRSKAKKVAA